ncbi:MAG TPA: hypothetical protein PKY05_08560 [Fibrobacteria bacterium]|nr:hypothetical protein [Fibrobacteria bacterium]
MTAYPRFRLAVRGERRFQKRPREGLKHILLGPADLYEALRADKNA